MNEEEYPMKDCHPPLADLRIIESSLLGPAALTTSFADLGAEVIKVESPAGDYIREMTWPIIEGVSLMHYPHNIVFERYVSIGAQRY